MKPRTDVEQWLLNACEVVTHSLMVTPPEGREAAAKMPDRYLFLLAPAGDQLRRGIANYKNAPSDAVHAELIEVLGYALQWFEGSAHAPRALG